MYKDNTTTPEFPKTLLIRNTPGGMIWQIYHVQKKIEAERLSTNAFKNAFLSCTLVDYKPEYKENAPDWRDTPGGLKIITE